MLAAPPADELAPYGFIAVASGQGIADIFKSLGVDAVLSGGQTMNPSTEDFVHNAHRIHFGHSKYIFYRITPTLCWLLSRLQNCLKANAV